MEAARRSDRRICRRHDHRLRGGGGKSLASLPDDFNGNAALIVAFVACALAALGPILVLGRGAAREPVVYYPVIAFSALAGSSLAG
jgi:hypothetical protein